MESGILNLLEPSGPHRACYGAALALLSKKSSDVGIMPGHPSICPFVSDLTPATELLSDFHEIRHRYSVHNAAENAWGSSKSNTWGTYYTEWREFLHVMSVSLYRLT